MAGFHPFAATQPAILPTREEAVLVRDAIVVLLAFLVAGCPGEVDDDIHGDDDSMVSDDDVQDDDSTLTDDDDLTTDWEPGEPRTVPCDSHAAVEWTPWTHSYMSYDYPGSEDIGCHENPLVEFFEARQDLEARLAETGAPSGFRVPPAIDYTTEQAVLVANRCTFGGHVLEVSCLSEGEAALNMGLTFWASDSPSAALTGHYTVISLARRPTTDVDATITTIDEMAPYPWAPN